MSEYVVNPSWQVEPDYRSGELGYLARAVATADGDAAPVRLHRLLPGYAPTPLRTMRPTADALGIGSIFVKDESERFGLEAFKPLGASYAVYRYLARLYRERFGAELSAEALLDSVRLRRLGRLTFCAATDGNHGRALAWMARILGQRAVIYMPEGSAPARIAKIRAEGAEVVLVAGTFDDCVARCAADARARDWHVIADTGYAGYLDVPKDIILGYSTLFAEADAQLSAATAGGKPVAVEPDPRSTREPSDRGPRTAELPPGDLVDLVVLQTGVGGLAAAAVAYYTLRYGSLRPTAVCVEPKSADGLLQSIVAGRPTPTKGAQNSVMAGLNCGVPSLSAWPVLRSGVKAVVSIGDDWAYRAMRTYAHEGIVSGESGASGLAGLLALVFDPELRALRDSFALDRSARVLLVNTEGDTDPESYRRVVGVGAATVRGSAA